MTRYETLNARIWDTIARARHDMACADVLRAKLRGDTQATARAEKRAREALHKILSGNKGTTK